MSSISFCINTARNEINHIKLLFKSLQENLSTTLHEIIVFVDSDNQGTTEWLIEQKSIFPNLRFMPTGGVDTSRDNIESWYKAGVSAVGMGSKLISNPLMAAKDYATIESETKKVLALIKDIRG